jgi:hypothetical protein
MAKRVRGSSRPAGRRPAHRPSRPAAPRPAAPAARPPVAPPPASLTADEEARAAELEAQIVARERAAEQSLRRSRSRGRPTDAARSLEPLSVRAAGEYAYVRRDVVRFGRLAALLLGILAVLYVLIEVAHVVSF